MLASTFFVAFLVVAGVIALIAMIRIALGLRKDLVPSGGRVIE